MARPSALERDRWGDTAGHERGLTLWMASSLQRAASNRGGLALAAAGVVSAIVVGLPALMLVAPAVFVGLFGAALFDGAARRAAEARAHALPIHLPDPAHYYDGRARTLATRLVLARRAIARAVVAGPSGRAFDVTRPLAPVPRIERDVVVLLARLDHLARFVDAHPVGELHGHIERLRMRAAGDDSRARAAFGRAAARCEERLDTLLALQLEASRLAGEAEEIVAALEQVPVELLRLQMRRVEACDDRSRATRVDVAEVLEALAALEAELADARAEPARSSG